MEMITTVLKKKGKQGIKLYQSQPEILRRVDPLRISVLVNSRKMEILWELSQTSHALSMHIGGGNSILSSTVRLCHVRL